MQRKTIFILIITILATGRLYGQVHPGFVQQETILVDTINTDAQIANLPITKKHTTRVYVDGLGRQIQSVAAQASPLQNDMIQPVVYDALGRQTTGYMPYTGQSTDTIGSYRANALSAVRSFYNNTGQNIVAKDTSPYAQQVFDNSPLQRLMQAGNVGVGFQPGQHFSSANYRFNNSTMDGNIMIWNPDGTFTSGNYYSTSSLNVTDGVDAGGSEMLTFTDMAGRTILKRQMLSGTKVDTYYIYNNAGMLSYIIPPAALALMVANSSYSLTQTGVNTLIFKYTYDRIGRLIEKTVPAKGTVYIVYDPMNRPVLMQDANMALKKTWNYIRYDAKNRPIGQGLYVDTVRLGRGTMQSYVSGLAYTNWYEIRGGGAPNGYYSARVFPTPTTGTLTPLAFAYYDNYDLTNVGSDHFHYSVKGLANEDSVTTAALKGVPTMVRLRELGSGLATSVWLLKVTFYDKRGNPIQVQSNNQLYYHTDTLTDYQTTVPNFVGVPQLSQVSKQTALGTTNTVLTALTYDHMFRVTGVSQQYNGAGTLTPVASYSYNELGQVVTKGLGYVSSNTWLQNVDMRYNIRGQLTSINNSKLSNDGGVTSSYSNDLFGMVFLYDKTDSHLGNTAYYDGKLSAVKWMSKDGSGNPTYERAYKYSYDQLDRYTAAGYAERTTADTAGSFSNNISGFDEAIGYNTDNSGNIATLTRNSSTQGTNSHVQIDNLAYAYDPANPNQLHTVTDGTGSNYTGAGFRNLTGSTGTYTYDTNGNLTADPYKGLTIGYDILNRTDKITVTTSTKRWVDYTYDGQGNLIRKRQYDNNVLKNTTDYIGGFVYVNDTLSYFPMPEGRVLNVSGTLTQEFIISDQQGNARVSFQNNGSGTAVVKQENSYYATGLIMPNSPVGLPTTPNKQLYNGGSEWQNDYSNLPDYYQTFNRNYDAAIARFVGVDPQAESAETMTSYQYAGNNPVMSNDPLGNRISNGVTISNGHAYDADGHELTMPSVLQGEGVDGGGAAADFDISDGFDTGSYGNTFNGAMDGGDYSAFWSGALGYLDDVATSKGSDGASATPDELAQGIRLENAYSQGLINSDVTLGGAFTYTDAGLAYHIQNSLESGQASASLHLGTSTDAANQGGITVLQYSPYNSGGSMGVTIALGYTDGGSGFRNFNWVQKISTNQPLGGARSPYNDPQPPDDNLPFYWTNSELPSHTNQGGFNSIFSDRPTRDANGGDTYWQSTLTVAGVIGNTYYPIINISYGFQIHNGQLTLSPITYSTPLNNSVTFSPFFPEKY